MKRHLPFALKSILPVCFAGFLLLVCSSGCIFWKLNAMFTPPVPFPEALKNGNFAFYYHRDKDDELYDQIGTNNGVAFNTTLVTDALDNLTNAYYFNGSNSYIQTIHPMQDLTNATFSLWFNANVTGKNETLLSDADSGSSNYCKIALVSDGSVSGIYIVANKNGAGEGIIITNGVGKFRQRIAKKWVNLIWVMSPTNQQVYVNGVEVANVFSTANDVGFHGNGLVIGADDSTSPYQNFFSGAIDNINIYNRALSSSEVRQFYDLCKP